MLPKHIKIIYPELEINDDMIEFAIRAVEEASRLSGS
jgi:hypothetical protein